LSEFQTEVTVQVDTRFVDNEQINYEHL